ncbi:uncharacterized protein EDB91DRAFT_1346422 [Suillus paluster]|uniref:uncharacterized protein n=1 Tax=Suillus paluster TaxID=48578 RepID=UPI001B8648AB|nr:uncharacterized protein EDB91DRAFT_1346422 [Suillus paluster]KAG1742651.1 hypothetical protein EDB91DRAFT_1346422 [Suillus paluster]
MSFTLLPQPTILYLLIITSQCPGLTMSDIPPNTPFIKPDYTPFCSVGHGELQWKTVTSHAKGNQGRWMVLCPFVGPDGIKCSHFRWGSRSPSSSPNPLVPPVMPPPPLPVLPVPGTCAESQCVSTRVHPLCTSAMCRKHCWAIGGCDAKGHAVSGPVQATLAPPRPPLPVIDPVLIQASLPGPSASSSSHASSSSFPSAPSNSTSTTLASIPAASKSKGKQRAPVQEDNFYTNPRYPLQLPPVFTNAYAMQEEEHLRKHQVEILDHELAVTAQNTVMVFGWAAADETPTICKFQSGFVLPRVRVTDEWLRNLGLSVDNGCHYFNSMHQHWSKISAGHVLTIPGVHIYLKNLDVKVAHDFDKYYIDQQPPALPHIRNNLKGERAYIRHATNYNHLQPTSSSSESGSGRRPAVVHKRKLASPSSSPPQHQRRCVHTATSVARRSHSRIERQPSIISLSSGLDMTDDETPRRHVKQEPATTSVHPPIKREPSIISISSSSSLDTTDDKIPRHRHIKQESLAATQVRCPLRITHELSLGASSNYSTMDGEMSSSSSPGLSHDHLIEVEVAATLAWPRGYYAVDINTGFVAMDNARQSGQSVKEAFASVFGAGVRYRAQTISDHRLRWKHAGPSARVAFIEAGRTPDGLWSQFMAAHPAKDAAERATKKHLVRG